MGFRVSMRTDVAIDANGTDRQVRVGLLFSRVPRLGTGILKQVLVTPNTSACTRITGDRRVIEYD